MGGLSRQAAHEGAKHCHRSRRHARDPERLTERVRLHLTQSLNDFARQTGNAIEREVRWNASALISLRTLDFAHLAAQVAFVLERRFDAGDVERGIFGPQFEEGYSFLSYKISQSCFGLTQ